MHALRVGEGALNQLSGPRSVPAAPAAPSDLKYPNAPEFVVNSAITPLTPGVPGTVTGYSVSPALPAGLSLDTSSGVISGTPTIAAAEAKYTVKVSNAAGSTTAIVSIVVVTASTGAPSGLNYPTPPAFVVNNTITPLTPSVTGTVTSYSVSPALPAGLSLSTTTGVISGTPTTATAKASYTIKASNAMGSTTAVVSILVANAATSAPYDLKYPTPPTFVVHTAITPLTPSVVGTVTSYSVSPALPAGLTLNTSSGVISGVPTSVTAAANYTVRASNAAGYTTVGVSIAVVGAPSIAYSSYYSFTANIAAQTISPTVSGAPVTIWAISPALPAGWVFDTTKGTISGTPTVAAAPSVYTVTGSNSAGQSKTAMTLAVAAAPLLDLGHSSTVELSSMGIRASLALTKRVTGSFKLTPREQSSRAATLTLRATIAHTRRPTLTIRRSTWRAPPRLTGRRAASRFARRSAASCSPRYPGSSHGPSWRPMAVISQPALLKRSRCGVLRGQLR